MAPVILRMDVHCFCYGCAGKIRRVVKNLLAGTSYMFRSILLCVHILAA